jgi:hypothetical protein
VSAAGLAHAAAGLEELAGLINFRAGARQDFGYAEPPTPDCVTIPPLRERSARATEAGHVAIKDIDQLIARPACHRRGHGARTGGDSVMWNPSRIGCLGAIVCTQLTAGNCREVIA